MCVSSTTGECLQSYGDPRIIGRPVVPWKLKYFEIVWAVMLFGLLKFVQRNLWSLKLILVVMVFSPLKLVHVLIALFVKLVRGDFNGLDGS